MAKIVFTGDLTIYQAAELKLILTQAFEQSRHDLSPVELDLSGINEIDAAGLQLLLSAAKSTIDTDIVFRLHKVPELLMKLFTTYNITNRFNLAEETAGEQ